MAIRAFAMTSARGALLAGLIATGVAAQGAPPQVPPPVTVAKPVVKEVQDTDEFIGRFEAVDFVELRARVQGYLERVEFTDGALVKAGDPLFLIDQRPYRLAAEQAESSLSVSQARLEFAQNDLERAEQLRRTGNITEQLAEQRRQNYLTAQAELNGARSALAEARLNLEFTQIRAPIAGRISRRAVTQGNLVAANTTVLTSLVSVDPIHFYFDVDERSYLAYARMKDQGIHSSQGASADEVTVTLTDTNLPPRRGVLDFVDNRVDQASGTMRVRARVPNPDGFLVPGLFGRIAILGSSPYRAALIPDEAIGTDQDRRIVMVVGEGGAVRAQVVRPGPRQDGYRVIREGLRGDETIVIAGIQRARPGGRVTPQEIALPPVRERDVGLQMPGQAGNAPAPGGNAQAGGGQAGGGAVVAASPTPVANPVGANADPAVGAGPAAAASRDTGTRAR